MESRRHFITAAQGVLGSLFTPKLSGGAPCTGIHLDFRQKKFHPGEASDYIGGRVFVDGQEVKNAWYIDTTEGVVKTYDVMGDGIIRSCYERIKPCSWDGIEIENEIYSRTVRGRVKVVKRFQSVVIEGDQAPADDYAKARARI